MTSEMEAAESMSVRCGKEKYSLQMKGDYLLLVTDVSEAALPKARESLTAIQKAMAELNL